MQLRKQKILNLGFIAAPTFAVAILLGLVLAATALPKPGDVASEKAIGKRVTDFTLDDQFERALSAKFAGKHSIVLIGDRKGLETMRLWEEKALKAFGDKVQIVRVAYFKGMPFFVPRGLARNEVKQKHPSASVLCDWDGNASAQFDYTDGCRIYFTDNNATIRAVSSGECSSEKWQLFMESIQTYFQKTNTR